uniref:Uncharacterized protein n=1 Tax=Tanacetum cinerariifolium TaxID=118510 RepID=A0A6L2LCG0_TANCI|nr:hypothetical protein [Tanacetum cinerariifolium]
MNKLVKGNLVRGLPSKLFENDQSCVACQKGKHHRASLDHLGKFNGKVDEGSGPNWLFDIDALIKEMKYEPIVEGTQSNGFASIKASDNACQARKETERVKDYILLQLWTTHPPFSQDLKNSHADGSKPSSDDGKKVDEDPRNENECNDQEKDNNVNSTNNVNTVSLTVNVTGINKDNELLFDPNIHVLEDVSIFNFSNDDEDDGFKDPDFFDIVYKVEIALYGLHQAPRARYETLSTYLLDNGFQRGKIDKTLFIKRHKVKQKKEGIFISQDKYVAKILKNFGFTKVKNESTRIETQKPMLKNEDVCACARYQDNLKVSHLYVVKRIFRKPTRKDTQVPQPSDLIEHVADEVVPKELGDSLVRAASTASSLEAEQDNGDINKTQSKVTPNESSSQRTDSCGGPKCQEAMGDTTAQTSLKRRVKKLEKKNRSKTHKLKRLYKVGLTARVESSDEEILGEDASKQWRTEAIDADEDITLVNDQDDADMFDVNDLSSEEVFVVEQEVAKDVNKNVVEEVVNAAQDSTTATTITSEERILAQALKALKTSKPKVKGIVIQE